MRLSDVKNQLLNQGKLDTRQLLSYATLSAKIEGENFQNLVAVAFEQEKLSLYRANIDGSLGTLLVDICYKDMENFSLKHRLLYSTTRFTCHKGSFQFFSYDKKVFLQGFRDAGLVEGNK